MFNFSGGLLAGQHDCKKERPPPARPIPVTFPSAELPPPSIDQPPAAWFEGSSSRIREHFLKLKRPSNVSLETLELLNVAFEPECDFETLVPYASKSGQPFLPPKSWLEAPDSGPGTSTAQEHPSSLLSNGRKAPDRNDFYVRAKEILHNNQDAFAALTRKALPGQVPPRLAHFRKFWEGLDNLAYYWDNSLDEYLPPKGDSGDATSAETLQELDSLTPDNGSRENGAKAETDSTPCKKQKMEISSDGGIAPSFSSLGFGSDTTPTQPVSISSSEGLPARTAPPKLPWATNMQSVSEQPVDLSKGSYRGYRIGNGKEMPEPYRLECVRAFLEPIAWAFAVTFAPHRRPPVLCIENVRFPVRMNTVGWRSPTDRTAARRGALEGPVIGVQCRPEVFGLPGDIEAESVLDAVRELGGMLLLAQERAREGKTEKRGGEDKWWTTKARWGGGPGGEIGVGAAAGTSDSASPEANQKADERLSSRSKLGSKRRPAPAEVWNTLRPESPLWDPKVVYQAIGKSQESDWDEVFMVSSLNHHISVLKLRVHRLYLQYLADGTLPMTESADSSWWAPSLQRTRWYDLFDVEDRKEAMRGLWGIIAYLMRAKDEHNGDDTME